MSGRRGLGFLATVKGCGLAARRFLVPGNQPELQGTFSVKTLGLGSQLPIALELRDLRGGVGAPLGRLLLTGTFFLQLEIKNHVFFSPINWDDLYHKRLTPPFNPNVVRGRRIPDSGLPGLVGVWRVPGPTRYRSKTKGPRGPMLCARPQGWSEAEPVWNQLCGAPCDSNCTALGSL